MGYNGYTEGKKATNKRYIERNQIARLVMNVPGEEKKKIFEAASRSGQSVNSYILDAIHEKMRKSDEIK